MHTNNSFVVFSATVISLLTVCVLLLPSTVAQEGALNRFCHTVSDCGSFGYICGRNGTCWCAKNFMPNKSGDRCIGGVGQKCKYDEHCIEGAFCEQQLKCTCKDVFYPDEDGLGCSGSSQFTTNSKPHLVLATTIFYILKNFNSL